MYYNWKWPGPVLSQLNKRFWVALQILSPYFQHCFIYWVLVRKLCLSASPFKPAFGSRCLWVNLTVATAEPFKDESPSAATWKPMSSTINVQPVRTWLKYSTHETWFSNVLEGCCCPSHSYSSFNTRSSLDASQACCCPPQVIMRHTYSVTYHWK